MKGQYSNQTDFQVAQRAVVTVAKAVSVTPRASAAMFGFWCAVPATAVMLVFECHIMPVVLLCSLVPTAAIGSGDSASGTSSSTSGQCRQG